MPDKCTIMRDTDGDDYVVIAEYPGDPYWRIGTLHMVKPQLRVDGGLVNHALDIGEVVRHGRCPEIHREFAKLVVLSETSGIKLDQDDYSMLIDAEGPVLLFADGTEHWYPGMCTSMLSAVTGHDPVSLDRERKGLSDGS